MKLVELIDVIDKDRVYESEKLEIIRPDADYDEFDVLPAFSNLLIPFYDVTVRSISATAEGKIRVELDWGKQKDCEQP